MKPKSSVIFRFRGLDGSSDGKIDPIQIEKTTSLIDSLNIDHPGTIPMPEFKSPGEVRKEAAARSKSIFNSFDTLSKILDRHEATIQRRWIERTRAQRLKVLLSAWPDMPASHRPDFTVFRKEGGGSGIQSTTSRGTFIWPYINQEDLLKPKTMLLLLNSRGRNPPSLFAAADDRAMQYGFNTKVIVPVFVGKYVMILSGFLGNSREYGRVLSVKEEPNALELLRTRKRYHVGNDLIILEAQERLLEFLVRLSLDLLCDIPRSAMTSDTFPILPEPHISTESEIQGFETLRLMVTESPYCAPAKLDLSRVDSLLAARASAAEDHLWALREDPGYFSKMLLEASEHLPEILKDFSGKPSFITQI